MKIKNIVIIIIILTLAVYFIPRLLRRYYVSKIVKSGNACFGENVNLKSCKKFLYTLDSNFLKAWISAINKNQTTFTIKSITYYVQGGTRKK